MKLLRAIRLDASDTFIFANAAEPGEAVTPGSFAFWDRDVGALEGKERAAFRSGFLGVAGGGFSTLAQASEADREAVETAIEALARLLVRDHAAPDMETARPAAREEIEASIALADHPPGTLIAMHRTIDENGEIREQFRTLHRRTSDEKGVDTKHYRAFTFFESDDGEAPAETMDFAAMLKDKRP